MNLKEFGRLKEQAEQLRRKAERAEGARQQVLATLQKDFGCKTLKAAEAMLAGLAREREELEEEFRAKIEGFRTKYAGMIDE